MANAEDSETRAAIISKWNSTPTITNKCPGGIHSGRLKPSTIAGNQPYAQVDSRQDGDQTFNIPSVPGQAYVDYRMATITVRGIGEKAIGDLMGAISSAFDEQSLPFAAPTSWMRTQIKDDNLIEDPETKAGEDIWMGVIRYRVWTNRII